MYTGPERRRHKRIKKSFIAKFKFRPLPGQSIDSEWNMVTIRNISAGGILFNFNRKINLGSILEFEINFPASKAPIKCAGRVLRVETPKTMSLFHVATIFVKINDKDKDLINKAADNFFSNKAGSIEP